MNIPPFDIPLYLPAQAASETEALIAKWRVRVGDTVSKGQILADVESAKSNFEFESPCEGTIKKLLFAEAATVTFDQPVCIIETQDGAMKNAIPVLGAQKLEEPVNAATMELPKDPTAESVRKINVSIIGLGGYIPSRVVKTAELMGGFADTTEEYIFGVTGIKERHWAADDEKPSDLAYKAALQAIEKSGIAASELGGIIVATAGPDVAMPSTACIVQEKLGIRGMPAFDLNAACSGWLYGLSVGKGLIASGIADNILVIGVELQHHLLDKTDKGVYFLFGDGAGAAILSGSRKGHVLQEEILIADAKGIKMAKRDFPGYLLPSAESAVDPYTRIDGHALFRFATESFGTLIRDVVVKSGWTGDSVRWVVPHQANSRILKAAAPKSGIPFERYYMNIERLGNTSSASIPLALLEIERGLIAGDRVVLCSVGAGVTAAAISIKW